jgi:hypothetical protein
LALFLVITQPVEAEHVALQQPEGLQFLVVKVHDWQEPQEPPKQSLLQELYV